MLLAAPTSTLCPYTTLFRSGSADAAGPGEGTRDSGGGEPGLLGDVVDRHALGCHLRPSFDADVTTTVGSMLPEPTATGGNQGRPDSGGAGAHQGWPGDRKSTRLNSSHVAISYAVFCLKKTT